VSIFKVSFQKAVVINDLFSALQNIKVAALSPHSKRFRFFSIIL